MRNIFILLLVCLCATPVLAQDKKYQVACIGFYNLENLFDTIDGPNMDEEFLPTGANRYGSSIYSDKLGKLADVISLIGTDETPDGLAVMGCSEVENATVLIDLARQPKLADRKYKYVHYNSPDERGIDVALLYNPKYFTPVSSRPVKVDLTGLSEDNRPTRDILFVQGKLLGDTVYVLVNHWPSRRGGETASLPLRRKAAEVCKALVDSVRRFNPAAKILIMGDLNDDPVSPSIAVTLGASGDTTKANGGLFNPWLSYYQKGIGTLAYQDSWNLFDQIILSSAVLDTTKSGFSFRQARIFSRPWMLQSRGQFKGYPKRTFVGTKYVGGYSDHLPTYIVLLRETP
jgi:hypothetical protein